MKKQVFFLKKISSNHTQEKIWYNPIKITLPLQAIQPGTGLQ